MLCRFLVLYSERLGHVIGWRQVKVWFPDISYIWVFGIQMLTVMDPMLPDFAICSEFGDFLCKIVTKMFVWLLGNFGF